MTNKGLTIEQLDTMGNSQLSKELEKAKAELLSLRFVQAAGNLEDHGRTETVHRDITRIYTIARERELGYCTVPNIEE